MLSLVIAAWSLEFHGVAVGVTEEVIKNDFTQIGKSFYRSPEFNQERAAMKAAREVVSPIS